MKRAYTIGIDLAKQSFQLQGARPGGLVAFRRKQIRSRRKPSIAWNAWSVAI